MTAIKEQHETPVWKILHEPLLHFLILGTLVYLAYARLTPRPEGVIEVKQSTLQALQKQQEDLTGQPLTEEEKQTLLESHIDEEVLLLEAERRGFDKLDYRVRQRLLNVMRSTLTENIPDPTRAQLEAYFRQEIDNYRIPESITFQQVYFSPASEKLPEDPNTVLAALAQGASFQELGDFTTLGNTSTQSTRRYLVGTYGVEFAEAVLPLPLDTWTGPIPSRMGTHFVKVTQRHPPQEPSFERLESYLREDYLMTQSREKQNEKIAKMREKYEIIVEGE
jgi:hypothetical protein